MVEQHVQQDRAEDIRVLDLFAVLIRERRLILGTVVLFVVLAAGAVLLAPSRYSAVAVLVPSQSRQSSAAQALLSQMPAALVGLAASSDNTQEVEAVLRSSSLVDSLVQRLGVKGTEEAEVRSVLARRTKFTDTPEGAISIQVTDRDSQRAAKIANEIPEVANAIIGGLTAVVALRKQDFLEQQLAHAHADLTRSEQELVKFQQSHSAPEMQEQAKRTMDAAAQLEQQVLSQEVAVAQLRRISTADNPELKQAIATLELLRQKQRQIRAGEIDQGGIFLSIEQSPELKVAAARLARSFTRNEQIYNSLSAALAQTQIDAQSDLPVVTVLDVAKTPTAPTRLSLSLAVGVALLFGFVFGVLGALARNFVRTSRLDPKNAPFFEALGEVRWSPRPSAARPHGGEPKSVIGNAPPA